MEWSMISFDFDAVTMGKPAGLFRRPTESRNIVIFSAEIRVLENVFQASLNVSTLRFWLP